MLCRAEILLRAAILYDRKPPQDSKSDAALRRSRKAAEENSAALDTTWPSGLIVLVHFQATL